jgi:hypothetical protein
MRSLFSVLGVLACVLLASCDLLMQGAVGDKAKEAEVKQSLHQIQLGVERVWAQTGACPGSLAELTPTLMPALPTNPFTKKPALQIPAGSPASAGDVTFVPKPDGKGGVDGYLLVAYSSSGGAEKPADLSAYPGAEKIDWSKVLIVLTGDVPEAP